MSRSCLTFMLNCIFRSDILHPPHSVYVVLFALYPTTISCCSLFWHLIWWTSMSSLCGFKHQCIFLSSDVVPSPDCLEQFDSNPAHDLIWGVDLLYSQTNILLSPFYGDIQFLTLHRHGKRSSRGLLFPFDLCPLHFSLII